MKDKIMVHRTVYPVKQSVVKEKDDFDNVWERLYARCLQKPRVHFHEEALTTDNINGGIKASRKRNRQSSVPEPINDTRLAKTHRDTRGGQIRALFESGMGCDAPELHGIGVSCPKLGYVCEHSQKVKLRKKFIGYSQGSYEF